VLVHVMDGCDLGVVVGYVGMGKSVMLGVVCEVWEVVGYEIWGAVLFGIVVENLESGSGIVSCIIVSMEYGWG
jgi:hypothetical protein